MSKPGHITILGGGLAGLAVGYYAKKNGTPFTIYEAGNQVGGNCITLKHGDFLFDSGAHRFHDKDAEVTREMKMILGEDLSKIHRPSQIFYNGKLIHFPLSPLNLAENLGMRTFFNAVREVVSSRLRARPNNRSFEAFALNAYGKTVAQRFLLNYSEKLWGASCDKLSASIAGTRMKGLNLRAFLAEAIFGNNTKLGHLEGSFYYPKAGIGAIVGKLEESCGSDNILKNSKVTKIFHKHRQIVGIELNGQRRIDAEEVVSTLPLDFLLKAMEPKPPPEIMLLAKDLSYRNIILATFFLNKPSVTQAATVYFPDRALPFTRIYEPRNRSEYMSPPGKTSLVAEIPCRENDGLWSLKEEKLIQLVRSQLANIGWIEEKDIIDTLVSRLHRAYPVLELGFEEKVKKITVFLKSFANLKLSGRNGTYSYTWIHNAMRMGKKIVDEYVPNVGKCASREEK